MRATTPSKDISQARWPSLNPTGSRTIAGYVAQQIPRVSEEASGFLYEKKTTCDSDEHAKSMFGWNQSCDQMTPGGFDGKVVEMWIKGMQIFRATANRSVCQSGHFWRNYRVIGIPVEMSSTGLLSRQRISMDTIFTFQSEQGFSLTTPDEFDAIGIAIPDATLEQLMVGAEIGSIRKLIPDTLNVLLPCQDKLAELRNCLAPVLDSRNFQPKQLYYPKVQRDMYSAIIGHVLETLRSAQPAPMRTRSFKAHSHLVHEAINLALANASEPPTVAGLCRRLKVSQRMLNYSFLETVGTAPLQYLRSRRLNGVRRDLRATSARPVTIVDVADRWGFRHLPRFSAEYRSLFGELPSETLRGTINSEFS